MKLKAFTLAEVLITLMIIGIVAALTIPSVISNYQQQEFKTGLKKAVSVLNEAIQTNIALDGETPYENGDLYKYLKRHLSILEEKGGTPYGDSGSIKNRAFYTTDGMRFEFDNSGGGLYKLYLHESGIRLNGCVKCEDGKGCTGCNWGIGMCGSYGLSNNLNNTENAPCAILVDVNGDKKPSHHDGNIVEGAYHWSQPQDKKITDIFTIMITDEKAIPFGVVAQRAMYSK